MRDFVLRPPSPRRLLVIAAALLVGVAAALAWHWAPERQVRLHEEHFLAAVQEKRWERAEELIAPDYRDQWGQDRAAVLANLREAFADYFACVVEAEGIAAVIEDDGTGVVSTKIALKGNGGPRAQFLMREAAELTQPFTFRWRKQSAWPWDWALVAVSQPELPFSLERMQP